MEIYLDRRCCAAVVCVTLLLLSGCTRFLVPEIGALAREDARIAIDDSGVQNAEWQTDDLKLTYSIDAIDDELEFSGRLQFNQSLTGSYSLTKSFFLKMSFIDDRGQVLATIDITPLLSRFGQNTEAMVIKKRFSLPPGSSGIVFNYYGVFKGEAPEAGDDISILYFPYEKQG